MKDFLILIRKLLKNVQELIKVHFHTFLNYYIVSVFFKNVHSCGVELHYKVGYCPESYCQNQ